jgi:hypothetical protein
MGFMLAEDMTRLCGEIVGLRSAREGMVKELRRETEGRRRAVSDLCAHFDRTRMELAKRNGAERGAFLSDLKRSVQGQCADMRNDLAGARRGWAGRGS